MKIITNNAKDKIRILHVVGLMDMGGLETWLVNVLRNINRQKFQIDFLVETTKTCAYDKEVLALGSKIIPCLHPSQPLLYGRNFKKLYRQHGPYDVIHSHIHNYSGYVLRLAKEVGIPTRIVHSHNDTSWLRAKTGFYRNFYLTLTEYWIKQYATVGFACSRRAGDALYGYNWRNDPRFSTHYCGIDLSKWNTETDTAAIRRELGIAEDAFVIGHVGRFAEQKNHSFLIDILAEVVKRRPKTQLLLVGDGYLRPEIEKKVYEANLTEHVVFAGLRSNIHQIMQGAMDAFVFPSFYEGLPLVLIEAQASGLPCIFSDAISDEANIVQPLVHVLSLAQPASYWAEIILDVANAKSKILPKESFRIVQQSSFNIQKSVQDLERLYSLSFEKSKVKR